MAFSSRVEADSYIASTDLRSLQFRVVDLTTAAMRIDAAAAGRAFGILANAPAAGEHATVVLRGAYPVRVGAAVSVGNMLTSAASGWAVSVTSGAAQDVLGRVLVAAASGMLATVEINPYRVNTA